MAKTAAGGTPKKAVKAARKRAGPKAEIDETRAGSGDEALGGVEAGKPLRPSQCRGFMRKRIAEEFPKIVHGFLEEAKTGNCAHVKLASELLEKPAVKAISRKKGSAERMLEELRVRG